MASPISNDKILPQTADLTNRRRSEGEPNRSQKTTQPVDDTVQLSSAGQLASQEAGGPRSSGNITSMEQARSVASRIREQIETAGPAAGDTHRRLESGLLGNLLETASA